jgi:hypothetical protein
MRNRMKEREAKKFCQPPVLHFAKCELREVGRAWIRVANQPNCEGDQFVQPKRSPIEQNSLSARVR